jgi:hypothetical protein
MRAALVGIASLAATAACHRARQEPVSQQPSPAATPSTVVTPSAPAATEADAPHPLRELSLEDLEAIGDYIDPDKDGLVTNRDNCPGVANPDQVDADDDGYGDACDPGDNVAPIVRLLEPAPGQGFTALTEIAVGASAEDTDGHILGVRFYANDQLIGEARKAPYRVTWRVPPGRHTLHAVATDSSNGNGRSPTVEIVVRLPGDGIQ